MVCGRRTIVCFKVSNEGFWRHKEAYFLQSTSTLNVGVSIYWVFFLSLISLLGCTKLGTLITIYKWWVNMLAILGKCLQAISISCAARVLSSLIFMTVWKRLKFIIKKGMMGLALCQCIDQRLCHSPYMTRSRNIVVGRFVHFSFYWHFMARAFSLS